MNLTTTLPIFIAAFAPMGVLMLAIAIQRRCQVRIEKPPQQEKLLRPPGYSLSNRLDSLQEGSLDNSLTACGLCAIAGANGMTFGSFLGARVPAWWTCLAAVAFAAFALAAIGFIIRAFRRIKEARNVRFGLRGEQAVGEKLHEVADCGFRIFHDLQGGENWNIDHVAVGTRGVFLIETKARRRRVTRKGQPAHIVVYDGRALIYPRCQDTEAIPQAVRNAQWLADLLKMKTAEVIGVEPLVVVPGWYVETKGNFTVKAMNTGYLAGYLRGQREKLGQAQVQRIIAVLDEKCRDVDF